MQIGTGQACPIIVGREGALILVGAAVILLSISSHIEIPMVPVPITAQTFMVLTVGAVLGPLLGAVGTVIWLLCGAISLPVLAGGASGIGHFAGPTAGFLFAFPIAALTVGVLVSRRQGQGFAYRAWWVFLAGIAGHIICLGLGVLWLSTSIGIGAALENGFFPFILGGIIKSAAVAAVVIGIEHQRGKAS